MSNQAHRKRRSTRWVRLDQVQPSPIQGPYLDLCSKSGNLATFLKECSQSCYSALALDALDLDPAVAATAAGPRRKRAYSIQPSMMKTSGAGLIEKYAISSQMCSDRHPCSSDRTSRWRSGSERGRARRSGASESEPNGAPVAIADAGTWSAERDSKDRDSIAAANASGLDVGFRIHGASSSVHQPPTVSACRKIGTGMREMSTGGANRACRQITSLNQLPVSVRARYSTFHAVHSYK